ncbi:MAG: carboxypeptidase regulatory-like domain-containing protein [Candidatus Aminicenantes bacterium]|nr:carboxypeptidase regulatory-like domain-containing protein [Candidatus Aminicenantes bacterium]
MNQNQNDTKKKFTGKQLAKIFLTFLIFFVICFLLYYFAIRPLLPGLQVVEGTVTDQSNNSYIEGAKITLTGIETTSGSEGKYIFEMIKPGIFKINATKENYKDYKDTVNIIKRTQKDIVMIPLTQPDPTTTPTQGEK